MENNLDYHIPVLLDECVSALTINPAGLYVDVTFGGGGHSKAIYSQLNSQGKLIAFDQDPEAKQNAWDAPNFFFVPANFSFISNHLRLLGIDKVDGIIADLGVSSHQFDTDYRGFSIKYDARLDMRMNTNGELTAFKIINEYDETELIRIFRQYGELSNSGRITSLISAARENRPIETTQELIQILSVGAPKFKANQFYAKVFQAIRIEVNAEMETLSTFLLQTSDYLKPGGKLVIMSYHSLEDRLVKNYLKRGSLSGEIKKDFFGNVLKPFEEVNRHPIVPSEDEIMKNPRSRSAKLRIAVKR